MKPSELLFGFLRIPVDFLSTFGAFLLAYRLRQISDFIPYIRFPLNLNIFPAWEEYKILAAVGSLGFIFILSILRGYSFKTTVRFSREIKKVLIAGGIWLLSIISYYFIIHEFPFSRLTLIYSWLLAITFICLGRFFLKLIERLLLHYNIGKRKVLIIGENQIAARIYNSLKHIPSYEFAGIISDKEQKKMLKLPLLGKLDDLEKIVKKYAIEEIIQTKSGSSERRNLDILNFCRTNHIQYHFVPDLLEVHQTNIEISNTEGLPLISLKPTPLDGWGRIIKRICDIIVSFLALIILSPLLLLIALIIKLDSSGPVLFSRLENGKKVMRVGQHGKLFHFIKFRTMRHNTHNMRYTELAEKNLRDDGPLVKIKNDPRITRFGNFLRKTSLDELPQLWSALIGHISLVGPRPHLPEEVAKYREWQKFVLAIKPGITGLPQINGRSNLKFDEEIRLDSYYIENWSIWLDLKILLKTFGTVFKKYEE